MLNLVPAFDGEGPLNLLCIGAHSDDLEIGCGGTLLTWLEANSRPMHVTWVVLSAEGARADEARRSARALLRRSAGVDLVFGSFPDGHLPAHFQEAKAFFESVKRRCRPDIVFTHRLEDRHQDHRLAAELTWNSFRDHVLLEYEIAKYEGDLGQPNLFVPLAASVARRKAAHLERHFGSQRSKDWFSQESFMGLARLRGIECRARGGYAEAFHARKLVLVPDSGAPTATRRGAR